MDRRCVACIRPAFTDGWQQDVRRFRSIDCDKPIARLDSRPRGSSIRDDFENRKGRPILNQPHPRFVEARRLAEEFTLAKEDPVMAIIESDAKLAKNVRPDQSSNIRLG